MGKKNLYKIKSQVWHLLIENRRHRGKHYYTLPSPSAYPYQWFWDSCFHAIILSRFDIDMAKAELRSLAAWQFSNGMIPHMIYWQKEPGDSFPKIHWGKRHTSSLIQPPLLAYAVWRVYERDRNKKFLEEMLPPIQHLHNFLLRQRDPHKHSLIGLINPDESGEDNSPRFDFALHLKPKQIYSRNGDENYRKRMVLVDKFRHQKFVIARHMERFHWVRDVPFNAIFASALTHEAKIHKELGDIPGYLRATRKSENVMAAMREYMLDGYVMWSTALLRYQPIKVKTWAMFAPLFANILTVEEAQDIVENYLFNPREFGTPYSVPTVSLSEPSFSRDGFWRGPIWMATNWIIYKGLKEYGFENQADKILNDSIKLISMSGLREYFDPYTGKGFGAEKFTWGGLVLDMLDDE